MSLLLELRSKYEPNEPIILDQIKSDTYSYDTIKSMLSNYVRSGKIRRFTNGVYYFPKNGILGEMIPSYNDYLERKYIENQNKVFGYYTGLSLLNMIGLSTQVPNVREITTNIETNKKRKVSIRSRYVILRKPLVKITKSNYRYLQFIDIFRFADIETIRTNRDKIITFAKQNQLKKSVLLDMVLAMSNKATTTILEEGFYNELTWTIIIQWFN